jgi:hypothetical protein
MSNIKEYIQKMMRKQNPKSFVTTKTVPRSLVPPRELLKTQMATTIKYNAYQAAFPESNMEKTKVITTKAVRRSLVSPSELLKSEMASTIKHNAYSAAFPESNMEKTKVILGTTKRSRETVGNKNVIPHSKRKSAERASTLISQQIFVMNKEEAQEDEGALDHEFITQQQKEEEVIMDSSKTSDCNIVIEKQKKSRELVI